MPVPANDEVCNWDDDIQAAVTAGVMVWTGSAQTGKNIITWAQFKANVNYDGTNPGSLADNQCPRYDALLARAVAGSPPTEIPSDVTFSTSGGGIGNATWTNTNTTDGIKVQYYKNDSPFGAEVVLAANATSDSKSGYVVTDNGYFTVWYYNANGNGTAATSNTVGF